MNQEIICGEVFGELGNGIAVTKISEKDCIYDGCIFNDTIIDAEVPYLEFNNCVFNGTISILNTGIGDLDLVRFVSMNVNDEVITRICVESNVVEIDKCSLQTLNGIELTVSGVRVIKSNIAGIMKVRYIDELIIRDSRIDSLHAKTTSIPANVNLDIENSYINGIPLNQHSPVGNTEPIINKTP